MSHKLPTELVTLLQAVPIGSKEDLRKQAIDYVLTLLELTEKGRATIDVSQELTPPQQCTVTLRFNISEAFDRG